MSRKLISFDYAMKYILRQKDNFDILEGFLSALLEDDITILELLESETNKVDTISKLGRVDLLIKDSKGRRIIIEIQHSREDDYLERMLWETSRTIVDNLREGQRYRHIVKVISISLMYFNLGRGDGYVYKGKMDFTNLYDDDKLKLVRDVFPEYYLIQIERFQDIIQSDLDQWIYMFKNGDVPERATAKHLDKAKEKLDVLNMTPEEKRQYRSYMRDKTVEASVLESAQNAGLEQGLKKGFEQGALKTKIEIYFNEMNLSIEVIADKMDLSSEQVQEIVDSLV